MVLRITVWVINQIARLGEAAIMRFPLDTDDMELVRIRTDRD